jgi:hypothetical protein
MLMARAPSACVVMGSASRPQKLEGVMLSNNPPRFSLRFTYGNDRHESD